MTSREMMERLCAAPDEGYLVVQGSSEVRVVPRALVEGAYIGYDVMGHASSQSLKRLQDRAGFGLGELAYYLAFAVMSGRVRIEVVNDFDREFLQRQRDGSGQ